MDDKDLQGIVSKISALCSQESAIDAAYLFGSAATGKTRPVGDIDVAVLLDNDSLDEFRLLSFLSSLERSCGCRADVVIFQSVILLLYLKHSLPNDAVPPITSFLPSEQLSALKCMVKVERS